jgi:cellulose synthase operon protein B
MKNRTIISLVNIFLCFIILLTGLSTSSPVSAQVKNEITIPFSEVGITDLVMTGPYDSKSLSFSLPDNWLLLDGSTIDLYVEVFITSESDTTQLSEYAGANLNVYFNRKLQQVISLTTGEEKLYRVPIHVQDLNVDTSDGRVQISFFLDAGIDCDYRFHRTTIKVSPQSTLNIIHTDKSHTLDLRNLPRPFYKRDSYIPDVVKVVIPNNASADELQAAYLVMSAFGRMTARELDLAIISDEQLTPSVREEAHLIFVGKANSFPALSQLSLPVSIVDGKFNSPLLQPDDGLLQMGISPWNSSKVILLVGGNSDAGVVKAGQALTTGNIQTSSLPTVSFIANIAPLESNISEENDSEFVPSLDYTLAELGYSVVQAGIGAQAGIGTQWFSYEFNIPVGQIAEDESYFDLLFSHSALIDPARSEVSVFVNGSLAGSVRFDEEKTSFVKTRIDIPPALIQPGRNQIDFAAELIPYDVCTTINLNGLWMSIYPESSIHLQLSGFVDEQTQFLELRNYPYPFLITPTMADLTIVLPQDDMESWVSFGDMIYNLGGQAVGEVISFDVSFSDSLSETDRQNNIILFGVPTDLVLDEELNAALPAPFEENSNVAILDNQTVVYRIEPAKSLGYLELLPSPWNKDKMILAVLGTNHEGLAFSAQALIDSKIRSGLKGNFATIDGEQFTVVDTRSGLGLGSFPAAVGTEIVEEIVTTPGSEIRPTSTFAYDATRQTILVVFFVILVVILLLVVFIFVSRKKKRAAKN